MGNRGIQFKARIAIGIVWLFHIAALIGMQLGHVEWFIEKTPLNLGISLILFLLIYPINNFVKASAFCLFFFGGMLAEWLGVHYSVLFGTYEYGDNLGPKLDGVPYLIGSYWALLTFVSASILDYSKLHTVAKAILAAGLMVLLDFFMEQSAPFFDFWTFEGGIAPFENYTTWFALAVFFQVILRALKLEGNKPFSLHLYLAQLLFFICFYWSDLTSSIR